MANIFEDFNKVNPNKKDKTSPSVEFLPNSSFPTSLHKKDYFSGLPGILFQMNVFR